MTDELPFVTLEGESSIYLDANATAPLHPAVIDAMEYALRSLPGNPSSAHPPGRAAAVAVARAREQVAALLACGADEVVFTGGGSEADNLALKGVAWACRGRGRHLIVSVVEHPAVLEPARFLEREGWQVTVLPADRTGQVEAAAVAAALRDDTVLVSLMHANNETGSLNPIAEIAGLCRERGILVHTDAAQSVGKVVTRVDDLGVDLLTVAAHKLYGPKGVGALYVRRGVTLESLIHGAGHEAGRRAGTENVPGIVGLGAAAQVALDEGLARFDGPVRALRDRLHGRLAAAFPELVLNGHPTERLPNTLNVSLPGTLGRRVLELAPEVEASTGSACHAGEEAPSGVLLAMGVPAAVALGALRLSLTMFSEEAQIDRAAAALVAAAKMARGGA